MTNYKQPFTIVADSLNREEWLQARRLLVTASDAAACLDESPYSSEMSVYLEKTEPPKLDEDNEWLEAGRRLEPHIAEWALEKMVRRGMPCGLLLQSAEFPWLGCTPDWYVIEEFPIGSEQADWPYPSNSWESPLQIKNTMIASDWTHGVPHHVEIQCQTEQIVTGSEWSYVAVLLTGNRMRWAKVPGDDELKERILEATHELWRRIQGLDPPPVDGHRATTHAIKQMHPDDDGLTVALPMALREKVGMLATTKASIKALVETVDAIENEVKLALGASTYGTFPDGSGVSYKTTSRKGYAVEPTTFRTLRRQEAK